MREKLLAAALEQAEQSDLEVKASALMYVARALAANDGNEAERVLEAGIDFARRLPEQSRSIILQDAIYIAATVSPRIALELNASYAKRGDPWVSSVVRLVNNMAMYGHLNEALDYLDDPLPGDRFPLHFVGNLYRECRDDQTRLRLVRSAYRAWRSRTPSRFENAGPDDPFAILFANCWNVLPEDEAKSTLREILQAMAKSPDEELPGFPVSGRPEDPQFSSRRQYRLFRLLPVIRGLDPDLIRSLLAKYAELRAAGDRFPFGWESIREEQDQSAVFEDAMMIGKSSGTEGDPPNSRIIYMTEALATDFAAAFAEARRRFADDSDLESPNSAPKTCWASTNEFRNILFKAGQHQREAAAKHLDRIPDPDLRLFAQIELCSALAGQKQIGHTSYYHKPQHAFRRNHSVRNPV